MGDLLVGRADEIQLLRATVSEAGALVVVHGEAGVGKTAVVRAALEGLPHREGGALATLTWSAYLPLRRAFGTDLGPDTWTGDPEYVAAAVEDRLDGDLLFLDDVHWADPGSRSVVAVLAGRNRVVTAVRRGDPGAEEALAWLAGAEARRIDLEPLSDSSAIDLARQLRPRLSVAEAESVVARSGGNPLLIEELVDTDRDVVSLRLAMLARCRALPDDQIEGIALLAVAGRPMTAGEIPAAPGLVESGLVREQAGMLSIRHALVGEVVGDLISEERRIRCHRALAGLLTHPGDVARHLLAAGDLTAAHELAMQAVEEAATPGERWRHLVTAAESAPPERAVLLRIEAAEGANRAADPAEAQRLLDGLPQDEDTRARAELARAVSSYQRGDHADYRSRVERAATWIAPDGPDALALLLKRCSIALLLDNDPDTAARHAREAMRMVETEGRPPGEAAKALGTVLSTRDEPGWEEMFALAVADARARGDVHLEASSAYNMIFGLEMAGQLDRAVALAEEMARRCRDLRSSNWAWSFEAALVVIAAMRGDHDEALARGERLLSLPLRPADRLDVTAHVGAVRAARGEIAEALAAADEVGEHTGYESTARELRIVTSFLAGRPHDVLSEWERLDETPGVEQHQVLDAAPLAAWAAWELGRPLPTPPPDLPEGGLFGGISPELAGIRALSDARWRDAAGHFEDAVRAHGPVARPAVHCRWAVGEALRLAEDPEAEQKLLVAEEAARAAGMVATVARCQRSLRLLGVRRSAQVVRSSDSPLTGREREVASLAAEGLTDREIAARLGVAHRTVQSQLASARRKLGAENRSHLVALLAGETG